MAIRQVVNLATQQIIDLDPQHIVEIKDISTCREPDYYGANLRVTYRSTEPLRGGQFLYLAETLKDLFGPVKEDARQLSLIEDFEHYGDYVVLPVSGFDKVSSRDHDIWYRVVKWLREAPPLDDRDYRTIRVGSQPYRIREIAMFACKSDALEYAKGLHLTEVDYEQIC